MSNLNYLHEYSTFNTVKEMDEAIDDHIKRNQYDLNDTDRDVLLTLSRYSVKYKGVAHLKVNTIAGIVGKSSITVRRALNKLVALNIIEKITFMREKSGGNGANIYRILPASDKANMKDREEAGKPTDNKDDQASENYETINLSSGKNNTYKETDKSNKSAHIDYIKRGLKNAIPAPLFDALEPFFNGQDMYDTYGVLLRAKASVDSTIMLETHYNSYIDVFYNVIRLYKAGRVRSLKGLLYVAWERLTAEISRQINAKKSAIFNDFKALLKNGFI